MLDLGRGAPRITAWVEPRAAALTVIDAVDLGRGPTVSLPLPDCSFDVVYCMRTLPHLGRDEDSSIAAARCALAEMGRVLVPGGTALVQIDNPRSLWGVYHGIRNPSEVVEPGALVVESGRGLTRFDTVGRLQAMLPDTLEIEGIHGLRLLSTLPGLLHMPVLRALTTWFEWFARDRALLRGFGAHLLLELRRRETAAP